MSFRTRPPEYTMRNNAMLARRLAIVVIVMAVASCQVGALLAAPVDGALAVRVDPLTRYVFVTYPVPADAPDEVELRCAFSLPGREEWKPAAVTPFLSATALRLTRGEDWNRWMREGLLTERRAAGLKRTVVFHPYPDAELDGRVDVEFRIQLSTTAGKAISTLQTRVQADNTDVVLVEDWSSVYQRDAVVQDAEPTGRQWIYRTNIRSSDPVSRGDALYGPSHNDVPLHQLTYPLDLRGTYAIFACTSPGSQVMLRLTGDESSHLARSLRYQDEMLFAWRTMDREDLIIGQSHGSGGFAHGQIDYLRLVPLSPLLVKELDAAWSGPRDKLVAAYYEPYSWAFNQVAEHNWQHPIQEKISKKHPEYLREESLRFELPEVRKYALDLYRETLQLGADSVSLDFCRYPETIDKAETATLFLRELRALTKEHGNARIIVRFPGTGVDGIYIYQADARLGRFTDDARTMKMLGSSQAVNRFWLHDTEERTRRSKGIYPTPSQYQNDVYWYWERLHVWLEGIPMGEVEFQVDGKLVNKCAGPPYILGVQDHSANAVLPPGEHEVRIRARDGDGWLERVLKVKGGG